MSLCVLRHVEGKVVILDSHSFYFRFPSLFKRHARISMVVSNMECLRIWYCSSLLPFDLFLSS